LRPPTGNPNTGARQGAGGLEGARVYERGAPSVNRKPATLAGLGKLALGIALAGPGGGWRRALRVVAQAEALGLHSVWLPEGHFERGATPSPLLALCAFAARTQRLRLATTSLLLPLHNPLQVAAEAAMLDALSGGRLLLGLGRGFRPRTFAAFQVSAAEKRNRFDAALDAILAAWPAAAAEAAGAGEGAAAGDDGGAAVEGAGEGGGGARGRRRGPPPLVVAAFGRKGLLQAARRGLPYLASPLESLDALAGNYRFWREHLAPPTGGGAADGGAGGTVDSEGAAANAAPCAPVMRTVFVAADDGEAARVLGALEAEAAARARFMGGALARAARGGIEERAIVGSAGYVRDGLARYQERLGMDLAIARSEVPGASEAARDASLERLATRVLPQL